MDIQLRKGMRLFTKDGRLIGNAIILEEQDCHYVSGDIISNKKYKIKTDFGNVVWLTDFEVLWFFYTFSPYHDHYKNGVFNWLWSKAKIFFKFND